jgi:DNA invertase Pin-like site-specific DNA recombinase
LSGGRHLGGDQARPAGPLAARRRAIAEELTVRQVRLSLGGSVYDPHDPVGRLLFNVLAMVAEFESDLIRLRTKEGIRVAKA